MADFDISDLIAAAIEKRPSDFKELFGQIMVDRAAGAVEAIKDDLAHNLVADDEEDPQYEQDYEDEYEDGDEQQYEDDEDESYEEGQDDEETQ